MKRKKPKTKQNEKAEETKKDDKETPKENEKEAEDRVVNPCKSEVGTTMSQQDTIPYNPEELFPTGGDSQWRDDPAYEHMWPNWRWPPGGWQPDPTHKAYNDPSSPYFRFNTYDWGNGPSTAGVGHDSLSPTLARTRSEVSETASSLGPSASLVAEQLKRCNTGDLSPYRPMDGASSDSSKDLMSKAMEETQTAHQLMRQAQEMMQEARAQKQELMIQAEKTREEARKLEEAKKGEEETTKHGRVKFNTKRKISIYV